MKSYGRLLLPSLYLLIAISGTSAKNIISEISPPKSGAVSADRVNVRARASLVGERVTQLRKGDVVRVLAKVKIDPAKEGEPSEWLKISMPSGGQTWVHMAFVKEGKVTATKLNVRAGGSERFSVVAHLAKNDEVKEKRTSGDWIEIEHPEGAHAFVAASFIEIGEKAETVQEKTEPSEPTETTLEKLPNTETKEEEVAATETATEPTESTKSTETIETKEEPTTEDMPDMPEPEIVVVEEGADTNKQPAGNPEDAEEIKPKPTPVITKKELPVPPPRIVTREGKIKRRFFRSPRAPSRYELLDEKGRTLNYLFSSDESPLQVADDEEPITFERLMNMLRNRKVILTGLEAVDPRWPSLPLLDVRTLKTVP